MSFRCSSFFGDSPKDVGTWMDSVHGIFFFKDLLLRCNKVFFFLFAIGAPVVVYLSPSLFTIVGTAGGCCRGLAWGEPWAWLWGWWGATTAGSDAFHGSFCSFFHWFSCSQRSWSHSGWKRPLRSPHPPMNRCLQACLYMQNAHRVC